METISLKMDEKILKEIDDNLQKYRYSTRTEFIRDSIRSKLTELEKKEAIRKITAMRGAFKGRFKMTDEEAGEKAFAEICRKHNLHLD
jgi:metal-responsive CopG/Arc/MetJ family transcriptional regulator